MSAGRKRLDVPESALIAAGARVGGLRAGAREDAWPARARGQRRRCGARLADLPGFVPPAGL